MLVVPNQVSQKILCTEFFQLTLVHSRTTPSLTLPARGRGPNEFLGGAMRFLKTTALEAKSKANATKTVAEVVRLQTRCRTAKI